MNIKRKQWEEDEIYDKDYVFTMGSYIWERKYVYGTIHTQAVYHIQSSWNRNLKVLVLNKSFCSAIGGDELYDIIETVIFAIVRSKSQSSHHQVAKIKEFGNYRFGECTVPFFS